MDQIKQAFEDKTISEDDAKNQEEQVQKLIDQYNQKLDDLFTRKQQEITTV